eukprot:511770-Pyramimonas_sp.AAC.1
MRGTHGFAYPMAVMSRRAQAATLPSISALTMNQSSSDGSLEMERWQAPTPASTTWPPTLQNQLPARRWNLSGSTFQCPAKTHGFP